MTTFVSAPEEPSPSIPHRPATDTEIGAVRAQAALVRSLLAELDDLAPPSGSARFEEALAAQTIEELVQLAHRMMDAAVAIAPHRVRELHFAIGRRIP